MSTAHAEANPKVEEFRELKAASLDRAHAASFNGGFVQGVRQMDEELVRNNCLYYMFFLQFPNNNL
jgi:hypothetical protein